MASNWGKVSGLKLEAGSQHTIHDNAKFLHNTRAIGDLSKAIARFNTLAQSAYDGAVSRQRLTIAGTITSTFAKSTLKAVVSSAIGTFGPGALTDVVFGDVAAGGGTNFADGWSSDNALGKGVDYALGGNGGYMAAGSSGMSRLSENAIKAGIGVVTGKLQGMLEDAAYDRFGNNPSVDVRVYLASNVTPGQAYIRGASMAINNPLPNLNSDDPTVNAETGAHQTHDRDGTGALIKEAVHQIDQLCYALNELSALDEKASTWASATQFRKCREMVEFMGKMYWFRRKYNKTIHYMNQLKEVYVAVGMVLEDMEDFWRKNVRAMELLAMRAAQSNAGVSGSSGGKRLHMATDLSAHGGASGTGALTGGTRNWRKVI